MDERGLPGVVALQRLHGRPRGARRGAGGRARGGPGGGGGRGGPGGGGGGFNNFRNGGGGGFGGGAGARSGGGGFGGGGGGGGGNGGFGGGGSNNNGNGGFGGGNGGNGGATAEIGGGGAGMGGAIFVRSGSLSLINSSFANNSATGGSGENNGQGLGGAIFAVTQAALDANTNNRNEPGSLPTVTTAGSVTFSGNTAANANGNTDANGHGTDQDNNDVFGTLTDIAAPALTSFTRQTPGTEATDADSLTFLATFDEAVDNVDAADFVVNGTTATISAVTGTGDTRTITVSGGDLANLNGTVSLDLAAGQDIQDLAGNALPAGDPATDEAYILSNANTAPTLTGNTTLTAINEDVPNASNSGTTVAALLAGLTSATDADFDPLGIVVTNVDDTNGTWQYSTDGGTTWTDFGTVNNNNVVTLGEIGRAHV